MEMAGGRRPNRVVITVVVASLIALSTATVLLRSVHAQIREERVRQHVAAGHALAGRDELASAADEYRAALLLERDNPEAGRALALTLLSLGRIAESESHLRELLRYDPTDGPLNRGLARIHALHGRESDARTAYQRAIYGEWPGDGVAGRTETRFELIDYLTRREAPAEVLAELLKLRAELPPGHTASARRAADLLVEHGAADLAIDTLRTTALTAPRDVELLAHLATLQADSGNPRDARATLRRAVELEPRRRDLAEQLLVVDRVLALDPTLPQLGLVARTRRARLLLDGVLIQTAPCSDSSDAELKALRTTGRASLRGRSRADAEAAEQHLALASRIWSAASDCRLASPEARAIGQVLQRVRASAPEPGT